MCALQTLAWFCFGKLLGRFFFLILALAWATSKNSLGFNQGSSWPQESFYFSTHLCFAQTDPFGDFNAVC